MLCWNSVGVVCNFQESLKSNLTTEKESKKAIKAVLWNIALRIVTLGRTVNSVSFDWEKPHNRRRAGSPLRASGSECECVSRSSELCVSQYKRKDHFWSPTLQWQSVFVRTGSSTTRCSRLQRSRTRIHSRSKIFEERFSLAFVPH